MIITGLLRAGKKIAQRADGLHALVYYTSSERRMTLWRTDADVVHVTLPLAELTSPACEFVGTNRLAICAPSSSGAKPARITEVSLAGTLATGFDFGDASTRAGGSCRLASGALFVNWRATAGVSFDVAFRDSGGWMTKRIDLPMSRPTNINLNLIQGLDGLAWVIITMDSDARVRLMRLRLGATIELVDFTILIDQHLADSISQEDPDASVRPDPALLRVIAGYQDANYAHYPIPNDPLGRALVTSKGACLMAVRADRTRELLARLPWENQHVSTPTTYGWAQADGTIYFLQQCVQPITDPLKPTWTWKTGVISDQSVKVLSEGNVNGQVAAVSDDGWFVERTPIDGVRFETNLRRMPFGAVVTPPPPPPPTLKVRLYQQEALFDWGVPKPGDALQYSLDGQSWQDWPLAGASPLWLTTAGAISVRLKR